MQKKNKIKIKTKEDEIGEILVKLEKDLLNFKITVKKQTAKQ